MRNSNQLFGFLLIGALLLWMATGGWLGWSTLSGEGMLVGVLGGVAGAVIAGVMSIVMVTSSEELSNSETAQIGPAIMLLPVGVVLGHLYSGASIFGILMGAIGGFLVGIITGFLITPVLAKIIPSWFPEVQEKKADGPKLEEYFARMQELQLDEDSPDSVKEKATKVTLSILPALHNEGKQKVLIFLKRGHGLRYDNFPGGFITKGRALISLTNADLRHLRLAKDMNFSGVDLRGANLRESRFVSAFFNESDLRGADLRRATLVHVTFNNADLREAKLINADLRNSHLTGADLRGADLRGADLRETINLDAAKLAGSVFDATTKWPDHFDPTRAGAIPSNQTP